MNTSVPPFAGAISLNAQHSPMGAFLSFTCGNFNTRGGIAAQVGRPGDQDLYIGVKAGGRFEPGLLKCLPMFAAKSGGVGAADYQGEQASAEPKTAPRVVAYTGDQIKRHYGWATDRWVTEDFTFSIYTPFGAIPDPAIATHRDMRRAVLPAVIAEISVDNSKGTRPVTTYSSRSACA